MQDKVCRILIVDDDPDIVANLSDILSDLGYATDTATSAEIAITKVEQECPDQTHCRYDLCLLDFKMPGMDGVELFNKIQEFNPNLRAIMITAFAENDGIQRAVNAGTWKILSKPVDIEELLSIIRDAISS